MESTVNLAYKRRRLANLRDADKLLREESMFTPEWVTDEIASLTDEIVLVHLSCLICSRTVTHAVKVDSTAVPQSAVCGSCANALDATVV